MSELPPTGSVEWKLLAARNEADRLRQYAEEVHQKHMKALLRIAELEAENAQAAQIMRSGWQDDAAIQWLRRHDGGQ